MKEGVSIVICCYNSEKRIPAVLENLSIQQNTTGILWEVVVIDNASTDNTAETALNCWKLKEVPIHIVYESKPGLSNARIAGLNAANYEYISFIDDDNLVCENWISLTYKIMSSHNDIGICGGLGHPLSETELPIWFEKFQNAFAVGPQNKQIGYLASNRNYLYGAGCAIRKSTWNELTCNGFSFQLLGRTGVSLSSGEDMELALAMQLIGYKLWYEPSLHFKHIMPKSRLNWKYLINLYKAFGKASLVTEIYTSELASTKPAKRIIYQNYLLNIFYTLYTLVKMFPPFLYGILIKKEGDKHILHFYRMHYLLKTKLTNRKYFYRVVAEIKNAQWRNINKSKKKI
ncbi:MAG: glycosyltransferase family 2 protein [Bacteroidales bacterium]|nr:glycosyltransferase family 2 protein [Bacteroidales bacterium]